MRGYNQFVVSYYGFQYPAGGLTVAVTHYPFRDSVSYYFGVEYFRSRLNLDMLKPVVRSCVQKTITKMLLQSPYRKTKILTPSDHWSMATFGKLFGDIKHTRIHGWVVRKAKREFERKIARLYPDLVVRRTVTGRPVLLSAMEVLDYVAGDPTSRLVCVKMGQVRWRSLLLERIPDLDRYFAKLDLDSISEERNDGKESVKAESRKAV